MKYRIISATLVAAGFHVTIIQQSISGLPLIVTGSLLFLMFKPYAYKSKAYKRRMAKQKDIIH